MSENVMLDTNVMEKTVSHVGELNSDRYHMQAVYQKKNPAYLKLKRGMDILLSAAALVFLAPVFLFTALAIKLEDGGPVLFCQYRAGKDMKPFKIYKFRSMLVNADAKMPEMMKDNEQTGHAFKIKNDPRITRVGKFIRKFSIDELPQLINIIKGDMSIVGPRPILTFQMAECSGYERQRLVVQPGLTCYWQIGGRANIGWKDWIEMDLDYIEDMSLWTDIKIIARTVPAVFDREGAY
ncbi:sugar transferase [Lachnospiraceae bacterium 54-11]